jgi:hypothetical protein
MRRDNNAKSIRILQHNCAKSNTIMDTFLHIGIQKADILLIQEPWIREDKTLSHPNYITFIPTGPNPRVATFVSKTLSLECIYRSDWTEDPDILPLEIQQGNDKLLIMNIYNEKRNFNNENLWTVERTLQYLDLPPKAIVCGDFNAHHHWWSPKEQEIRAENLITWLGKFKCYLINEPEVPTYNYRNGDGRSVLDLVFATPALSDVIFDWAVNEDLATGSDHEVIQYSLYLDSSLLQITPLATNKKYNLSKTTWELFLKTFTTEAKKLLENNFEQRCKSKDSEQMNLAAFELEKILIQSIQISTPPAKICSKSKRWWKPELSELRTKVAKSLRVWKNERSAETWSAYQSQRNFYFHSIREAKQETWKTFLTRAQGKEIFTAVKYCKGSLVTPIPQLHHEGSTGNTFKDKCKILKAALFPTPPDLADTSPPDPRSQRIDWEAITQKEISDAIFTSSNKKAPGPDSISFLCIQKAYSAFPIIFNILYTSLLQIGYHPRQWRQATGVILKKSNKPDYSAPKAYRVISLLNCLGKISEKIIAKRLSYWGNIYGILHKDQMGGRIGRSAIDAGMAMVHDIQLGFKQNEVTSAAFLDVKGAFDHVSKKHLLSTMYKLALPLETITFTESLLSDRYLALAFDGQVEEMQPIEMGIPQGSPISPILFLIYIRFLFDQVEGKHTYLQLWTPSFIDDIAVVVQSKSAIKNIQNLEAILETMFNWANCNGIQFDNSKTELIHFSNSRNPESPELLLPNGTIIQPSQVVRWLGIWLDPKLNFKEHCNKRFSQATRTLHTVSRLSNREWGLQPAAFRQIYLACIVPIADYASELWWNNQSTLLYKLQLLQNLATRKITGAFKTAPSAALEMESYLPPVRIRLDHKLRAFAIRAITFLDEHPLRTRSSCTFPPEDFTASRYEPSSNKYSDWDEASGMIFESQYIRILNSALEIIPENQEMDFVMQIPPWKDWKPEDGNLKALKAKLKQRKMQDWKIHLQNADFGKSYPKDSILSRKTSAFFKKIDRHSFSTWIQLKTGHGYFKSYISRVNSETDKRCHCGYYNQNPQHLLMDCKLYKKARKFHQLEKICKPWRFSNLLSQKTEKVVLSFLKDTKIGTRKWYLGQNAD